MSCSASRTPVATTAETQEDPSMASKGHQNSPNGRNGGPSLRPAKLTQGVSRSDLDWYFQKATGIQSGMSTWLSSGGAGVISGKAEAWPQG